MRKFLAIVIKRGDLKRFFIIMIEVACITVVAAMRNEARLHFLMIDLDPIDRLEPAVFFNVHTTIFQIAVSSWQIYLQNVLQYVPQLLAKVMRELVLARYDLLVDLHGIMRVEWRVSRVHLVDQHAKAPPIDGLTVTLWQYYFRRQIFRRAAQSPRAAVYHLAETEIGHPDVAGILYHDILRFEISIN